MLCKNIKEEIFEAVLSGAAPGENAKAHMLGCGACEKEYESMRSTMNLLDTWETPEPSPYFDVRLRARLREAKGQEQHGRVAQWLDKIGIRQLTWKPVAAGVFALIMAVGGGLYMGNPAGIGSFHGNSVQAEAACPVVDLHALDKNQQVLNALQDLEEDTSNNSQSDVSE